MTRKPHKFGKHAGGRALWLLLLATGSVLAQGAGGPPPAPVLVAKVERGSVAAGKTHVGTILPRRTAVLGSAVSGRVVEVNFDIGDPVKRLQPLVTLLTDTIRLDIEAAEAELSLREQELAELRNGTRPEELDRAKALMLAEEARLDYLKARRSRVASLFESGRATSEEERDEALSSFLAAEQAYAQAKASYALAVAGPRAERIAQAEARVRMQHATVERLRDQLQKHTLIPRIDGFITKKYVEPGQWVNQGEPMAEMVDVEVVEVEFNVVEQDIPHIRLHAEVAIEVPAFPETPFQGEVESISPQGDIRSRTFPVRVRIPNQITENGPLLRPGMLARARTATGPSREGLLVPKDAVVLGGPQPIVFVVVTDGESTGGATPPSRVRPVPVQLGESSGDRIEVRGDLQSGDLVVVQGNERLRPDQPVLVTRPDESAADRDPHDSAS